MLDIIQTLQNTPLPTILVVFGIFFIFLSIAGGFSGKINVPPNRQVLAAVFGTLFMLIGIVVYIVPPESLTDDGPETSSQPGTGSPDAPNIEAQGEVTSLDLFAQWPLIADDTFTSREAGWTKSVFGAKDNVAEFRTVSGKYRLNAQYARNWHVWKQPPYEPAVDFYLAVDVRLEFDEGYEIAAGPIFRRTGDQHYFLQLNNLRQFSLLLTGDGNPRHIIDWTSVPNVDPAQNNRLAVVAEGALLRLYINERLYGQIRDESLTGGNAGVGFSIWTDAPATAVVDFDNFEFRRKPEG